VGRGLVMSKSIVPPHEFHTYINRQDGVLVPVHADIPDIETVLLDDYDEHANHLGVKGLGELGICGTGAAVSNAVFNATGIRVRFSDHVGKAGVKTCRWGRE
jgi:xanthine dehydrogenase YagR molybdenum-binding subunit